MPTVKSKLKEELEKALREANEQMILYPKNRSARAYASAIQRIIKVCEDRQRY